MASSSSSLKRKRSYDVFLSFRGTDVRNNFLSHLYTALYQNGISTYMDSEEMRKGDQIQPALMKAIEESQFAIIIFSKDYASSSWCLEEVAKIMECKTQKDLIVLPVFYKVEPREVRWGRGSYGRDMAKHESDFGNDSHKVKRWKKALFDASELSGWTLNDEVEAELIKEIVSKISMQIDQRPVHVAEDLIGIHPRLIELNSMLKLGSDEDVRMIGLWGTGGIGKTTLGLALYNNISRQFEGSCFLTDVCKALEGPKDLAALQKQLLSDILPGRRLVVSNVHKGISLMQNNIYHKKVLLVLDNVTDRSQLDALAGNLEWFGAGSKIIFITRDKHLLISRRIDEDYIYEVKPLENCDAFELLRRHAFPSNNSIRRDLVDKVLHYANGHPLALKELGCFLYRRSEREWESSLNILAKILKKTSNDTFKWSYDGLDDNAKEICLDIACFFTGYSKEYIMKVLDSCNFEPTIGLKVLIEKSLVTEERETLQMCNMVQLMAMDIIKQEYPNDPGRRSRLWLFDDFRNILSRHLGTNAIKAIVLRLPRTESLYIGPSAFRNMIRLRVLIMINVHNSFQGPMYLPNELRYFEWPECPSWILEFSSGPKKLVGLDLSRSNVQVARMQFKDFECLKFINLSEHQSLICMPDLSYTPYLEELDLHGCKNLEHAHESVAYHSKLRLLQLSGCSKLCHLPNVLKSKNLEILNLNHCSKLQRFPDIPDKIKGMRGLYLIGTSIEKLPASIENLVSLEEMDLRYCKKLEILPSNIYRLLNLERLMLEGCSKLVKFPKQEDPSDSRMKTGFPKLYVLNLRGCNLSKIDFLKNHSCFPSLRALYLLGNNFTNLPTCEQLHNLLWLDVLYCQQQEDIPQNPGQLSRLWSIGCESLSKLPPDKCDIVVIHRVPHK